ncbi:MAG: hypothetical protein E2O74_04515 [Chloroflexi bacterium]|nr:MAG: hypothetical protein E2O74_04515 [Chloroflexota bacterium]
MNKRIAVGTVLILGSLLTAGCNLPFAGEQTEPEAQVLSTEAPSEQDNKPDSDVISMPTEAPEADIDEARGTPIARLDPDTLILITYIQMITAERGWGIGGLGGNSDHVFRTNDGGQSWMDVTPAEPVPEETDPSKSVVGYFLNPMTGWVAYYEDSTDPSPVRFRVWGTTDGGETWSPSRAIELEFLGTPDFPPLLGFEDADNGWLIARYGPAGMFKYPIYLLRTADGGKRWEMAITPAEGDLQSCRKTGVDFGSLMVGWATVADCPIVAPEVAVTRDGGRSWEPIMLPAPENRPALFETELCEGHSPQLVSELIGVVAVSCRTGLKLNYIYTTEDGGASWESYLYPGGELALLNPRITYAFGRQIHQTVDGGRSWDFVKTVQWDGQFSFVSDQVGWAVARQGEALALVSTTNGGRTWNLLKPSISP